MSRFIDRLLVSPHVQLDADVRADLQAANVMDITNVAEFVAAQGDQLNLQDIPRAMPPFDNVWTECRVPNSNCYYGHLFQTVDSAPDVIAQRLPEIARANPRWWVCGEAYSSYNNVCAVQGTIVVGLMGDGALARDEAGDIPWYAMSRFGSPRRTMGAAAVTLLAFAFANCRNVTIVENHPDPNKSRRHRRLYGRPLVSWRELSIEPMVHVLREKGQLAKVGLPTALHIVRGNFAEYTADRPLFGRHTGLFWRPQHMRGRAEHGVIVKDYKVSPELCSQNGRSVMPVGEQVGP